MMNHYFVFICFCKAGAYDIRGFLMQGKGPRFIRRSSGLAGVRRVAERAIHDA
jgi:hypothetical protein